MWIVTAASLTDKSRRGMHGYLIAVLATVVMVLIRQMMDPWLGSYQPLATL
jgi:hypothetical protein